MTAVDPGAICSATLLPTVFGTGSYGWKGSRRVAVRVPAREVGVDVVSAEGDGEGEMVTVMISCVSSLFFFFYFLFASSKYMYTCIFISSSLHSNNLSPLRFCWTDVFGLVLFFFLVSTLL